MTARSASAARQVYLLLSAKAQNYRPDRLARPARVVFGVLLGVAVLAGAYRGAKTGAGLIMAIDPENPNLGLAVTIRMLELGTLFLSGVLGVSNLIAALTTFFLARDLELIHPLPVRPIALYLARLVEVVVQGAWVMVPVVIPMLCGVGSALGAPAAFFWSVPLIVFALVVPPSAIAVAFATIVARLVPAGRAREVFLFLAAAMFVALYILVRLARPEQFIHPDRFGSLPALLESMGVSTPWLPSTWASRLLVVLTGRVPGEIGGPALLLLGLLFASVAIGAVVHLVFYAQSQSRARESRPRSARNVERLVDLVVGLGKLTGRRGFDLAMLEKEARTMLRDPQQWTQILMLGALLVLFVYNFRFLKDLHLPEGVDLIFNLGLSGFVIGALGIRFVFPLVSLEGGAFWVLRSAPISSAQLLKAKLWTAFVVLEALALAMASAASLALGLPPFSIALGCVLVTPLAYLASALGVGLGAAYPRFTYENPVMIPMSFGGMMYMYWSMGTVLAYALLLGWPLYAIYAPKAVAGRPLVAVLTVLLGLIGFALPWVSGWMGFRIGVQRLDEEGA